MNQTIAEALAPFRPLTYTEHYYIGLWDWQPLNAGPAAQYTSADTFEVQA